MRHFYPAIIVSVVALLIGVAFGYITQPSVAGALLGAESVIILALMETAESMDNAIVDARILKTMTEKWQKRYLTFGMPVAVLGMRFLFPAVIVSAIAAITPWQAITLAFKEPHHYAEIMTSAKNNISAFGGTFLLMIALSYFIDEDKEEHWLTWVEAKAARLGGVSGFSAGVTLLALLVTSFAVADLRQRCDILLWGGVGIVSYILIKEVLSWLIGDAQSTNTAMRGGFLTFCYLEFIDGSFSFDSVISAFAITNDPVIIAAGLGVGAMVVRCMTLAMLRSDTLAEFAYVEHGAFYTILILAILMLASILHDIPEWLTGSIGLVLIGGSFVASVWKNKQNAHSP
ncbi:DUF475 domain-containing protein [Saccharibacter floricola]|uniref:DUF475 domain-containing protein n=1 Tax=Saccharibacter floricola DSM 15669 TaxID=1123227 RepID=A0ABQ0NWS8_9PROT|nr:DUF475 domain-containing protein [Saccharibacter floricola]GBQ05319.1 hypothetical protein AA15669_0407 [Saccharibacter floricola DSM 15669]